MPRHPALVVVALIPALAFCAPAAARPIDPGDTLAPDRARPACVPSAASAVIEWNSLALRTTAQAPFDPPRESRSVAIAQAAVLDAVSSITHAAAPYRVRVPSPRRACIAAAVAAAAHRSLVELYPEQRAALDDAYARALAGLPPGEARDSGVSTGEAVAAAILALRAHDGSDVDAPFTATPEPGRWVPTPPGVKPALEPGWGRVTPFLLRSSSELRPPGPPALDSARYARDQREIEAVGSTDSAGRTPDQTEAAQFWVATAPQLWNQVIEQIGARRHSSPTELAVAFASLNLAGADAFIAAWDAKFTYEQWRPVTAIRATADSGWTPLLATPPFPDYPAAHTTFAGAAETVLTGLFGSAGPRLRLTSPIAERSYESVRAIADEVENARVWGGVHWRTSSEAGRTLGRRIGRIALRRIDGSRADTVPVGS
jgi:hypothetical protein